MSKSYNDSPIQLNNANEWSARTLPKTNYDGKNYFPAAAVLLDSMSANE